MKLGFSYCFKICMRVGKESMKKKHYWKKFNAKTKMKFIMKLSFSYCFKICMRVDKGNMKKKNHYRVKLKIPITRGNKKINWRRQTIQLAKKKILWFMMKLSFSYCLKICMRVDKRNLKKNHYQVKFKQGNDKKKKSE